MPPEQENIAKLGKDFLAWVKTEGGDMHRRFVEVDDVPFDDQPAAWLWLLPPLWPVLILWRLL